MLPRRAIKMASRHSRFLMALAMGVVAAAALPISCSPIVRMMVGWNTGVFLFLALVWQLMTNSSSEDLRIRYEEEDATAPIILILVSTTALVSLVAIVKLLATVKHADPPTKDFHLFLAALTVFGSWLVVPTMFALHYADMFYSDSPERRPLIFPEDKASPVFWDFVYFSFTIAAACQTADIATRSVSIRKIVAAQAVLAFVFNAAVFGFAVNVSASLVGS